ncbi:MAG: HAD-IC family P-type ATPase, partial [Actinomycetia bacterium]|nr:HAD-IC family P-type ATPase [Actinomycetes bacterium]
AGGSRWSQLAALTNPDPQIQQISLAPSSSEQALLDLVGNNQAMQALTQADSQLVLALAAAVEQDSEHPLAQAVVQAATDRGLSLLPLTDFQAEPGRGVQARISAAGGDALVLVGNPAYLQQFGVDTGSFESIGNSWAEAGKTPVFVALAGELIGALALADTLKPNAAPAVAQMQAAGLEGMLLSGDNHRATAAVGQALGIAQVIAEVLPTDKAAEIAQLRNTGRHVAMVGDGINDAPALVESDLGLAIGSGTDIAMASADIVLMKSDPLDIPRAIHLARLTLRTIKQNLFWAFAFNIIAIPIAAGLLFALGGPLLNPMISALAMSLSSLVVTTNALRLKGRKL